MEKNHQGSTDRNWKKFTSTSISKLELNKGRL